MPSEFPDLWPSGTATGVAGCGLAVAPLSEWLLQARGPRSPLPDQGLTLQRPQGPYDSGINPQGLIGSAARQVVSVPPGSWVLVGLNSGLQGQGPGPQAWPRPVGYEAREQDGALHSCPARAGHTQTNLVNSLFHVTFGKSPPLPVPGCLMAPGGRLVALAAQGFCEDGMRQHPL